MLLYRAKICPHSPENALNVAARETGPFSRAPSALTPALHALCRYFDDVYEYRHVILPPEVAKLLPKGKLLTEVNNSPNAGVHTPNIRLFTWTLGG